MKKLVTWLPPDDSKANLCLRPSPAVRRWRNLIALSGISIMQGVLSVWSTTVWIDNVCVLGTTYNTNVHIENTLTAMSHDGRRLPKVFLQSRKLLLLKFKFSFGVAVRAKSSLAHLSNGLSCIHRNQWKRLCLIKTFCSGSEKKMLKHFYSFPCFNSSLKLNSVGLHTHITNIYGSIPCVANPKSPG